MSPFGRYRKEVNKLLIDLRLSDKQIDWLLSCLHNRIATFGRMVHDPRTHLIAARTYSTNMLYLSDLADQLREQKVAGLLLSPATKSDNIQSEQLTSNTLS